MVAADGCSQLIRQVVAQTTPRSYLGRTVKLLPTQLLTGQHMLLLLPDSLRGYRWWCVSHDEQH